MTKQEKAKLEKQESPTRTEVIELIQAAPQAKLKKSAQDVKKLVQMVVDSTSQSEMKRAVEEAKIALDYCGLEGELAAAKAELVTLKEHLARYARSES